MCEMKKEERVCVCVCAHARDNALIVISHVD